MRPFLQANCFATLFYTMLLFLATTNSGCGSDDKKDVVPKTEVKAAVSAPVKFQETADYIPAMYLDRSDLLDANSIKYKDKLVLQLFLDKARKNYRLTISPTGKAGKIIDTASLKYPKAFVNDLPASSVSVEHIFEEHHTKENDFQKLWDEIKKYKLVNYILFEPVMDSNHHFCYKISGVEKLPASLSAEHGFATKTYYSHPSNHVWK